MDYEHIKLSDEIKEDFLLELISNLNQDICIDGIIVQLPLPKHINEDKVINAIDSNKDVDGFGIHSKGQLFSGLQGFKSATPYGIIKLLEYYNIKIEGKNACVIGRSNIVGKPMAIMLLDKNATVTICHSRTVNLAEITKEADILVSAVGKAKFVTADMVKKGAVVVDVGMNRDENGLCGDVDFQNVEPIASYISPVPGGVGPLTITMLLANTLESYRKKL
jgi:methylenetetrahydrofolate dehydrogenase (NADP+)/methenyltetrahydrofolate cyclohydrolase